ncbi:MAG: hypothetical protein LBH43_06820 [Treponema sp.]|jgi:carbon starvation protein CstA|nr:hypothetical protein [Treponema sp.]
MNNETIGLLILIPVLGIGLAVLYNMFVIKNYPEKKRKGSYVKTAVVFFLISVVLSGVVTGRSIAESLITKIFAELNQDIANKNIVTVVELKAPLFQLIHKQFGISEKLFNFGFNYLIKVLPEDVSRLQVSSIIDNIVASALKLADRICLVIAGIFILLLLIYVLKTFLTAVKAKKTAKITNEIPDASTGGA